MSRFLLDTDILINWIRGELWERALLLRTNVDFYYSSVSRKELFKYKKITQKERKKIIYLLSCFREVPVTQTIAQKSSELLYRYSSNGLKPADALIAASAWDKNFILITRNQKHFSFIKEIKVNQL